MMLTDNNQIFRNWFVIIHCHLTKVSAQIIQGIIYECNELSITLSTLLLPLRYKLFKFHLFLLNVLSQYKF